MALQKHYIRWCVALGVTVTAFQGAQVQGQNFLNRLFGGGDAEQEEVQAAEPEAAEAETEAVNPVDAELEAAKSDAITSLVGVYEALIKKGFPIKERPEGEVTQILFYLRSLRGIIEDINERGIGINERLRKLSDDTVGAVTSEEFSPNTLLINLKKVRDNKPAVQAELIEIKKELLVIRGMLDKAEEYGLAMVQSLKAFWNTVKDPLVLARYPFDKQMRAEVKEIKSILEEMEPMVKSVAELAQNLSKTMIQVAKMFTGMNIPDPDSEELNRQIDEAFSQIFKKAIPSEG